jgi:hypothetical protein
MFCQLTLPLRAVLAELVGQRMPKSNRESPNDLARIARRSTGSWLETRVLWDTSIRRPTSAVMLDAVCGATRADLRRGGQPGLQHLLRAADRRQQQPPLAQRLTQASSRRANTPSHGRPLAAPRRGDLGYGQEFLPPRSHAASRTPSPTPDATRADVTAFCPAIRSVRHAGSVRADRNRTRSERIIILSNTFGRVVAAGSRARFTLLPRLLATQQRVERVPDDQDRYPSMERRELFVTGKSLPVRPACSAEGRSRGSRSLPGPESRRACETRYQKHLGRHHREPVLLAVRH